ncbi:hypothetical protein DMC30DRAFT_157014 [Rhodotorula diobovata]|uniref:GH16 domain-containing protein n=1 Tax=Rhodotorula diobovata TaxID=5288 RepID=A0A5C5G1H0_9BASI|nr:hypothetical protein DMC30DRAFT_157014 [Rhodotorula diobovata]
MATRLLAILALVPSLAHAAVQPTWPGGKGLVFRAGDTCSFRYKVDTTNTWTSFAVDLMSGSNYEMVEVTRIASDLDGTVGDEEGNAELNFTCPEVDPPAPIYFLEATQDDKDPVWTNRFALAAPNGTVVPAPHNNQPDDETIPWGVGALVNGTDSNSTAPSSTGPLDGEPLPTPLMPSIWLKPFLDASSSTLPHGSDVPITPSSSATAVLWGAAPAATSTPAGAISGFQRAQSCDKSTQCPESAPCCSEEGFCGTGRNCLAGCDPLASFQPGACAPVPACVSGDYQLNSWNANRILANSSTWNGDATTYDWLVDKLGHPELSAMTANSETGTPSLTLSLTEQGKGTVLTSTRSVLYGNVTAQMKSVAGSGILTSFALLSGTGDEIDYEFTTNATDVAQTAFFSQGDVDDYSSGQALNTSDRAADFHNFTILWTPDAITWLVDGVALRNVSKNSTADPLDSSVFHYPQTPARIQFSIWAPGREEQPEGLVDFAGGAVDWNSSIYSEQGYYASYVSAVSVACYDPALLPGFSLDPNAPASYNSSAGLNGSAPAAEILPADSSSSTAATESATLWWTPPGATDAATSTSATLATAPAWWTPASKLRRRRLRFEKVRRAESPAVGSYTYGLDANGALSVAGSNLATTIEDDAATGISMHGALAAIASAVSAASATSTSASSGSITATATSSDHASASHTQSDLAPSASASGDVRTIQQKWDDLGTAAHVGI